MQFVVGMVRIPVSIKRPPVISLHKPSKLKVEAFTIEVAHPLSQDQLTQRLTSAESVSRLPDGTDFAVSLVGLFDIAPTSENRLLINCVPVSDSIDHQAFRWCDRLAKMPPKTLPRSQRPLSKLLKRLPEFPTGNVAFDRARRVILDKALLFLWPAIVSTLKLALTQPQPCTSSQA